jgi:DNA-3-methyladenine glycosylase
MYFTLLFSNIMNLRLTSEKLNRTFYEREDVLTIAQELLGKLIVTSFNGVETIGRIIETEAYQGITDRASHAYNGRRTPRTETMYRSGGVAYVYLCYGIHHLFNVVTNRENIPHAVLVRAIEPVHGKEVMLKRSGRSLWDTNIGSGPGNVSRAMGIATSHSGMSLQDEKLYLAQDEFLLPDNKIIATPRIGVDYAGEDALLPYRFVIAGHPLLSAKSFTSKFIQP